MSDSEQPYVPVDVEEIKAYPPFPFPDLRAFIHYRVCPGVTY